MFFFVHVTDELNLYAQHAVANKEDYNYNHLKKWSLSLIRCGHFTRHSNYRDLARNNLVFWVGGCLCEVVAHGSLTACPLVNIKLVFGNVKNGN